MTGRRRHRRFALASLATGVLEVLEEVSLESTDGVQFEVLAHSAHAPGDRVTLHLAGPRRTRSIGLQVTASELQLTTGEMLHRVQLRLAAYAEAPREAHDPLTASLKPQKHRLLGMLQQDLAVDIINISRSGCQLCASRSLDVGTLGRLRVSIPESDYAENMRVARCVALDHGWELGVEFLWMFCATLPNRNPPSLTWRISTLDHRATPRLRKHTKPKTQLRVK
jgi:hypothetical protein